MRPTTFAAQENGKGYDDLSILLVIYQIGRYANAYPSEESAGLIRL